MFRKANILIILMLLSVYCYSEGRGARAVYDTVLSLRDVNADDITNGEVLVYNSSTEKFESGAGGGSGTYFKHFSVQSAKLTGADITNPAGIDAGDRGWLLLFDDTTEEEAVWQFVVDPNYTGGDLTLEILYSVSGTQTGITTARFDAKIMSVTSGDSIDFDSDGYASQQSKTDNLASGLTSGYIVKSTIAFSNAQADSIAVDDIVRIHLKLNVTTSTVVGDVEVVGLCLHE